jgi:hypothetical protein
LRHKNQLVSATINADLRFLSLYSAALAAQKSISLRNNQCGFYVKVPPKLLLNCDADIGAHFCAHSAPDTVFGHCEFSNHIAFAVTVCLRNDYAFFRAGYNTKGTAFAFLTVYGNTSHILLSVSFLI